ncbi:TAP-like protein [Paraburkholderia unamae]|uniref:alpha/beta fold hydrolase n=1 Tax=Paraburkholderia unamae TaxID=219649 RepID=UPI000DC49972|nr:alpha/beta fold hydrolase [Paraburkholderia unamae]RAR54912.1 TAP-like protein [Paraburkholderia unamae]
MNKKLENLGFFSLLLSVSGLYGCSGGSTDTGADTALAPYYTQAVAWHDCSSDYFSGLDQGALSQLSARTRCATMNVPLDYDDLSKGSVGIGVLKVSAGKPASRLGAIWTNPGGPGVSGLNEALDVSQLLLIGNPSDSVGAKLLQLSDSYDVIGFDPRGVGSSVQLVCSSIAAGPALTVYTDRSAAAIDALVDDARAEAAACGGTPLTPYINTEFTARDMEVMRAALGYDKLNYFGTSYGTTLGAGYASLFPDRTGRMVLDSVVDITLPLVEYAPAQAPALQHVLDGIVAPYVASHDDLFGLGASVDDVRNVSRRGPAWLTSWLGGAVYHSLFAQSQIDGVVTYMAVVNGIIDLLAANPAMSPSELKSAVDGRQFLPQASERMEARAHEIAAGAVDAYVASSSGSTKPVGLAVGAAANVAVTCNDGALTHRDQQYWTDLGNSLAQSAPLRGGSVSSVPCLYWPFTARKALPFERAAKLPILLLEDENDGATPLAGARATAALLKGSRLLIQDTDYSHGALFTDSTCVLGYAADYLLNGSLPPVDTICAGKGLPAGTQTATAASGVAANAQTQTATTYTDPAQAEAVLKKLRDMVQ